MGSRRMERYGLWALVAVLVASTFATIATAQASSTPNYSVSGYVDQPNGISPMKAGVTVDLISAATHQVLTTTTGSGGLFTFNTSNTGGALTPGWWGLWVPNQAHLHLGGSTEWAVVPTSSVPTYGYLSASNLTSASYPGLNATAALYQFTGTISGQVTSGGSPVSGASVELLDGSVAGFDLNNTTTNASGKYSFEAPPGTWILETTYSGPQTLYNVTQVTVPSGSVSVDPVISQDVAQGFIYSKTTGLRVAGAGNVTLYDTSTHTLLTEPTIPGFYSVGTYPAGYVTHGTENFIVLVNPDDYSTVGYAASVGYPPTTLQHNIVTRAIAPAAQYNTSLTFSPTFGKLNVTTTAVLGNDSVFPDLANASVGQLWAQLGLDFNGGLLSFDGTNAGQVASFTQWLASQGPFFPAGEAGTQVNGTTYGQPTNDTFTAPVVPNAVLDYTSPNSLWMNWTQAFNETSSVTGGGTGQSYNIAFNFRHPVGPEAINYTVHLPSGYALAANTVKPAGASILPAGPDHTYTSFILDAHTVGAGQPAWGSANFTVVKYANFTANVNISLGHYFAYSTTNVLNGTHSNYTVVVGTGQNVTFSALNSTYPDGTNGTFFQWNFGGASSTTTNGLAYHSYGSAGVYKGNVVVTSGGGLTSRVNFTVLVGAAAPTPTITSNATASEKQTAGSTPYLLLNWSTTLQFNVTGSSSTLASNLTEHGVLADAVWTLTATKYNTSTNYSAGTAAKVDSNLTLQFLGAGLYFHNVSIGGTTVAFYGWWYNLTLTLWDGQGHKGSSKMAILVRDTEKPVASAALQNSKGTNVSASGLVEAANHTAEVIFDGQYSKDPHNGSIVRYYWQVSDSANKSAYKPYNTTATKWTYWLNPQSSAYSVNLTVFDRAGNSASTIVPLSISINTSTRPVLSVSNLTAPSTMTDGSSYTIWGNVTNTIGQNSTAVDVTVAFYLTNPGGTVRTAIGTTSDVKFYWYTNGAADSNMTAQGTLPKLAYNQTVRAVFSWTPGKTGSFDLYMNASAANMFSGSQGPNVASTPVTLNANPASQLIEYAIIAVVAVVLVLVLVWWLVRGRNRSRAPASRSTSKSGGGSSSGGGDKGAAKKPADDDDEDDDS